MVYIKDPNLFKAVHHAVRMIAGEFTVTGALTYCTKKYGVEGDDILKHLGLMFKDAEELKEKARKYMKDNPLKNDKPSSSPLDNKPSSFQKKYPEPQQFPNESAKLPLQGDVSVRPDQQFKFQSQVPF